MLTPHEKGGDHYPFKGRGRTQIARHNLDAFEVLREGGMVSSSIYSSNCVLFAKFHFSRPPHSLHARN